MKPFIEEDGSMQAAVRSHSGRAQVGSVVIYGVVAIFTFLCVVPFWYVLVSSFSQNGGFWIDEFTLDGYLSLIHI